MAEVHVLRQLLVSDEATFCEFLSALGSVTWEKNIPILEATFEAMQDREEDTSAQHRLAVQAPGHKGARRGRLRFKTYWMGHVTDPTGALAETWQQQLLGDGLGTSVVSEVGGLLTGAPTVTSLPFSPGALVRGGVLRVGSKGDGGGDGQAAVVGSSFATPAGLLTALPAAPAAGAVMRACQLACHSEGAALVTKRFGMLFASTGAQFFGFGAQLSKVRFGSPVGGKGTIDWEYEIAYYERSALAFSTSLALQSHDCAPVSGGSAFVQDFATTTRATKTITDVVIDLDLGLEPIPGVAGAGLYQWITGWTRTRARATISFNALWDTSWETWWDTENPALVYKHMLLTFHAGHGRAFGAYAPRIFPAGRRPNYPVEVNGQNYVPVVAGCAESTDTTNELTRSALRIWSG